jgi:hypothetical protein
MKNFLEFFGNFKKIKSQGNKKYLITLTCLSSRQWACSSTGRKKIKNGHQLKNDHIIKWEKRPNFLKHIYKLLNITKCCMFVEVLPI